MTFGLPEHAPESLFESTLDSLDMIARGKVRDIYEVDDDHLLIVASDRLSAFDVVLPQPIPLKGWILNSISRFWFDKTRDIIDNHVVTRDLREILVDENEFNQVNGRAMLVRRLDALPIEAVVRGYLIGSGWKDYQSSGMVCGIKLPEKLQQAGKLPEPIYTPATKAAVGEHDENISFEQTIDLVGEDVATAVRDAALQLYDYASGYAAKRGIIIADTKFEFGLDADNNLVLIDEALTPDSSRFWPADKYRPGISPPSFDKQFVRDYLETLDWDKTAPGPELPDDILSRTRDKYLEAYLRLAATS
jgi:phosphoribosylaminoimidazole-succinocarboxamide synthase